MKSVAIFLPEFRAGTSFADEIINVVSQPDCEVEVVYVKKNVNPLQQQQFLFASYVYDVVIVDCTMPNSTDNKDGGVYPALTAQINVLNHIIAISETPLPLNITPYRKIAPSDNEQLSSLSIFRNLPLMIATSLKEDNYPRIPGDELIKDFLKYQKEQEEIISTCLDRRGKFTPDKTKVMISYRNSHSDEVESLKKLILDDSEEGNLKKSSMGLNGTYEIKVLPPASLCGEFEAHTPMRRWMLVGILEDHIREVDEVWVYESRDSDGNIDYTNSWWTIAEMIMVANVSHNNSKQIKVRVFNPVENRFYESTPDKYIVNLTEKQHKRLARYLSNTRPDTMGPECMDRIKQLTIVADFLRSKFVPKLLKKQMLEKQRSVYEMSVPKNLPEEERTAMIDEMMSLYSNPDEIDKYVSDDVFQEAFWNDISYQTIPKTSCFVNDKIDVDKFMAIPMEELTGYRIEAFTKASESDSGIININGIPFQISKAPYNRFLWLATRMGQPTQKDGCPPGLDCIQIYNVLRK